MARYTIDVLYRIRIDVVEGEISHIDAAEILASEVTVETLLSGGIE